MDLEEGENNLPAPDASLGGGSGHADRPHPGRQGLKRVLLSVCLLCEPAVFFTTRRGHLAISGTFSRG